MCCNFDQVPTEILNEEINRRRAVIEFRTSRAEELLTKTAKMLGAPTYGTLYAVAYVFRAVACSMLIIFAFLCGLAYYMSMIQHVYFLQIVGILFLFALTWFHLLNKEFKRVVNKFLSQHPEEAKLLGYQK